MKAKKIKQDPEAFFKLVSLNAHIFDIRTIKDVYYGLVRTMSRQLREGHVTELPDWGTFNLRIRKEHRALNIHNGQYEILPEQAILKFIPNSKVKDYFHNI